MMAWLRGLFLLTLLGAGMLAIPASAESRSEAETRFEAGRAQFEAGDVAAALGHFQAAQAVGMNSPALHYNLGVCYFRLQRYPEAVAAFRVLTAQPDNAAIGHYNIGLIAQRLGKTEDARAHYWRTLALQPPPAIRSLAETALRGLPPEPVAARHAGIVSVAMGYDDNVTLESESDLVGVSDNGAGFLQLLAGIRSLLSGTRDDGVQLEAGAYLREYDGIERFDQQAGRLGLARLWRIGDWAAQVGGHVDLVYLDGDRFQTAATATLQGTRGQAKRDQLLLRYRAARIDGADGYDQLSGWRHRLQLEQQLPAGAAYVSLGYLLEHNDREDLESGGEFISQSPLRNAVYADLTWPASPRWEFGVRGDYRHSAYRDNDVRVLPAGTIDRRRKDQQLGGTLRAVYTINSDWRVYAQLSHVRNDSNLPTLDYTRNEAQLGLEVYF